MLLIEDEPTLAHSLRRGLEADGISSDWASNGPDGLWQASEGVYDAVVLDIMLPGMNGYEVCRRLREAEVWTPILILTAKDGEFDEAEAFDLGADDYLRKPFHHVVLVARIRALARRVPAPRPALLICGSLQLDPATLTCERDGVSVELSQREFAVLEALMRRAPAIVSKADLLDLVWGIDFEGDPNILEVYIGYLRKKVDRAFGIESIQTVRGVGYRVVAQ